MDSEQLRRDIIEEIGPDAYSRFDEERYAIEEIVLHLLVDACIIEFVKGFFDFESLGKDVRLRVDQFLKDFRESPQLITLNITPDVDKALRSAEVPSDASSFQARERLVRLLKDYGMDDEVANAHAGAIEKSILSTLSKPSRASNKNA